MTNGYDFQAHLIEGKILPEVKKSLDAAEGEYKLCEGSLLEATRKLLGEKKKKWEWKYQAGQAGMPDDFEFIYSYTSRLLHAGPVSITTNQKNLELGEMRMFLDYIHIRIVDIVEMAERRLAQPQRIM